MTWTEHVSKWKDCRLCPLAQQRDNIVLARAGIAGGVTTGGSLPCDVVFVGEAPGASEDATGLPFWGPAGDLLQQIIERALPTGMAYAACNLVCCFPRDAKQRGDNEPEDDEIRACQPRLAEFVLLCGARLLVSVGTLADTYIGGALGGATMYAGGVVRDHASLRRWTSIVHPAHIVRMPLAQKQMAAQKAVIVLRNAVENMLQ